MTKKTETHDYCLHEREFGEVTMLLSKISKEVYGNGEVGLSKSIPRMEEKINNLCSSVSSHTTVITKLLEYQATTDGLEKGKKEKEIRDSIAIELKRTQKRDNWQKVIWVIMGSVGIIGIAISIYFGIVNSKKNDTTDTKIENLGVPVVTRKGEIMPLPADASIKFFPKGFTGDTTKQDTTK